VTLNATSKNMLLRANVLEEHSDKVIIPRRKILAEDIEIVSVCPSDLPSVLPSEIFVRSISLKVFKLST
jgi:hypothetical protein